MYEISFIQTEVKYKTETYNIRQRFNWYKLKQSIRPPCDEYYHCYEASKQNLRQSIYFQNVRAEAIRCLVDRSP